MSNDPARKIVFVGISGPSCSGKTTLARALHSVLPDSAIIHQENFTPPSDQKPLHPTLGVRDHDEPSHCTEWSRFAAFLRQVKVDGRLPSDREAQREAQDRWVNKTPCLVSEDMLNKWRSIFFDYTRTAEDKEPHVAFGVVDGFLLYWHPEVVRELDVRIFLRVPYEILKSRRKARSTRIKKDGSVWEDPADYWDLVVWPAYLKGHAKIFANGDVSHGEVVKVETSMKIADNSHDSSLYALDVLEQRTERGDVVHSTSIFEPSDSQYGQPVPDLQLLGSDTTDIDSLFESACEIVLQTLREAHTGYRRSDE